MKLKVSAFALAFGIWWGGGLFIATWWMIYTGVSPDAATLLTAVYPGYSISAVGSLVGLVWGFFCGAVCGGIFAWLYNLLAGTLGAVEAPRQGELT